MRPLVTEIFLRGRLDATTGERTRRPRTHFDASSKIGLLAGVIRESAQVRDVKVDEPACRPGSVISREG